MERVTGTLPISIATSLAIEGALGIHPDDPNKGRVIDKYKQVWFNLRTLVRNVMGSYEGSARLELNYLVPALEEDILNIVDLFQKETSDQVKPIFYVSEYSGLERKYPYARLRKDTTEMQKAVTIATQNTINEILKVYGKNPDFKGYHLKIKEEDIPNSLIVTHAAYDLVSRHSFKHLDLLESHTGLVKPRNQWYTKYADGKDLARIPFREDMLQIFGDSYLFRPMEIGVRKEILQIAEKYNWTALTTSEKIRYGVNTLSNEYLKKIINSILIN